MRRILLTGCGGAAAINVARSLKKDIWKDVWLIGVDKDQYKIQRSECNTNILIDEKNLIDRLNNIIDVESIDFIHAQPWRDVLEISKHRKELKAKTFLPNHQTIVTCTDKYQSYLAWKKAGIKVPETIECGHPHTLREMIIKYGKCWVRLPEGAGGAGAAPLTDTNYTVVMGWLTQRYGRKHYLVSEYLSPRSVTWMSLWFEGELVVAQGRERIYWEGGSKFLSGVSGVTGAAKTVSDRQVDQVALDSIKAVDKNPHGIFSVDMTYDKEGVPNPTEINIGKFFTTVNFFTHFGLNMPEMYLDLAFGDTVEPRGVNPLPPDLVWIRGVDMEPILTSMDKIGT